MLTAAVTARLAAAGVGAGTRLCLGLSGGIDSRVLLDVLLRLQPQFGFILRAAHVHHGLSPHADAWIGFCTRVCAAVGVPLQVSRVAVDADQCEALGLEAAARLARHAALDAVACDWLVLAHHRDDQAETLLFRLLRGSGVRGAGAMRAQVAGRDGRPGRLRPLLDCSRAEIRTHAEAAGLLWVDDESNADCRLRRNYLRHRVLPVMEAGFPGAAARLARAAAHFQEADQLLGELAEQDRIACGGERMVLARFLGLSAARRRNLLRHCLSLAGEMLPEQARLDEVLRQVATGSGPLRQRLGGVAVCVYRGCLWMEAAALVSPVEAPWRGQDALPWGDGWVRFVRQPGGLALPERGGVRLGHRDEAVQLQCALRRPARSLKKLCQASGIPPWQRDVLPVLWVGSRAVWVGGLGADVRCLVAPEAWGWQVEWLPSGNCSSEGVASAGGPVEAGRASADPAA